MPKFQRGRIWGYAVKRPQKFPHNYLANAKDKLHFKASNFQVQNLIS